MGWMDNLYQTYENSLSAVGVKDDAENMLLPVAHSMQNAQIEVVLSIEGEFLSARLLDKKEAEIVIPVTEDSGARANGITPHPLHDKLIYVAGDYEIYSSKQNVIEYYNAFMNQLEAWCNSVYGNVKVQAIYNYLSKKTLIHDLIQQQVLFEKDGKLDSKVKLQTTYVQEDAFVRFRLDAESNMELPWKDRELFDNYTSYYLSKQENKGLCYVTGKEAGLCEKHPSRIRHAADKAKLISGNDSSGFTYRGRFIEKDQVAGVSYKVSQEAHNALKWLLQKQGYVRDGLALVAWESCNKKIPDIMVDTMALFEDDEVDEDETLNTMEIIDTKEEFGKRLKSAIKGYSQNLSVDSKVMVISVDAATPGRLSIIYYREIAGSEFLDRIKNWHTTCRWIHNYRWKDDKRVSFEGAPSLRDIVLASFGTEQSGVLKVSDKLMLCSIERLLPCVVDKARIPYDIVHAAYNRAISPLTMSDSNWNKVLTIACSLVRKFKYDKYKEEWSMNLDYQCSNYDYLCGRLLAVADEIEQWALNDMNENRQTNAKKYFNQFAKNPCKVWKVINNNLQPYEARMGRRIKELLELKQEISSQIAPEVFRSLRSLDGTFILGYDSQKREFNVARELKKAEKAKENEKVKSEM